MRTLILKIIFFLIPILFLLYWFPVSERKLYAGLKETCANRSLWVYDRNVLNQYPADIIFFGSSHTLNGIDDKLIDEQLNSQNVSVVNMGQCSLGVDLYYAYLKEAIKYKKPKHIIMEVRNTENRYSHPVFPYIASNKDVLIEPVLFNRDYISNNYRHIYYKMEIIRDIIFGDSLNNEVNAESFGCRAIDDTMDLTALQQAKNNYKEDEPMSKFATWFYMSWPRSYYEKIAALCKSNQIEITFLYIPAYIEPYRIPDEYNFYGHYGKVLMPPDSIFRNTAYWFDESHLNQTGAKALSSWVAEKIKGGFINQ